MRMNRFVFLFSLFSLSFLLNACTSNQPNFAPVTDGWQNSADASSFYRVQPDDTLYSIAFRYGLDYRALAAANHIAPPYRIEQGQKLQLGGANEALPAPVNSPSQTVVTGSAPATVIAAPVAVATKTPITPAVVIKAPASASTTPAAAPTAPAAPIHISTALDHKQVTQWLWPAKGKVIRGFSNAYAGTRGIDIAGKAGDPVRATAAGQVVYCGSGLRGYGLLIIIKHNAEFLSAYAHNSKALVAEGDMVKAGQKIALMGDSEAPRVMLHFEIRREGQPVNPMSYLPPR